MTLAESTREDGRKVVDGGREKRDEPVYDVVERRRGKKEEEEEEDVSGGRAAS